MKKRKILAYGLLSIVILVVIGLSINSITAIDRYEKKTLFKIDGKFTDKLPDPLSGQAGIDYQIFERDNPYPGAIITFTLKPNGNAILVDSFGSEKKMVMVTTDTQGKAHTILKPISTGSDELTISIRINGLEIKDERTYPFTTP